jgi:hypothetical protein
MRSLEEITAWHEVMELSLGYAQAIDARDWTGFESLYADEVAIDFSSFNGLEPGERVLRRATWVRAAGAFVTGFTSTQHLIANQLISFEGSDTGSYSAYLQAQHWIDRDRWYLVGGRYQNRVRRIDGRWVLSAVTLQVSWDAGDRSLADAALQRREPS